ncbi:MAG: inositol monophosphatase family protein, partial [Thermodesulfobacteriota bacterium]
MNYESEISSAVHAVGIACELCKSVQMNLVSEETMEKKDKSPVTVADFGAQAIVIHELINAFPDDPIVAEEDARELTICGGDPLRESVVKHLESYLPGLSEGDIISRINMGVHEGGKEGRFWTLDPIDGTKGFLRNQQYAVALALIENGEVVLGVLGCPNLSIDSSESKEKLGTLLYAVKGQGAFMKPIDKQDVNSI